jgi:acyl-CoA thioester hydrolase
MYSQTFIAGWADMDFNAHMRNTSYLDRAADVRMMFYAERGFPMSEFMRLRIGPVVRNDDLTYFREVRLLDRLTVTLALAGAAPDGSRWIVRNEFFLPDGQKAATVNSTGGWLDLNARKLVAPPAELLAAMTSLERTSDYQELSTSVR